MNGDNNSEEESPVSNRIENVLIKLNDGIERFNDGLDTMRQTASYLTDVKDTMKQMASSFTDVKDTMKQMASTLTDVSSQLSNCMVRCDKNFDATNRVLNWLEESNYTPGRPELYLEEMTETTASFNKLDKEENVNNYMLNLNYFRFFSISFLLFKDCP